MNAAFWNERYGATEFVYGTQPNAFLESVSKSFPAGPILCLAEGEGRNAVFLASLGHAVTAVDQSSQGLAKARRLAAERGVSITTLEADLSTFTINPGAWSGIVATFAHLPKELRRAVHHQVVAGLCPGGLYALEAYTPAQLAFDSGGPKDVNLLMTLAALREELSGLEWVIGREIEREVVEGTFHSGRAAVVQILGLKR